MEALFLKLLNMSISAGWLVLAVILLRGILTRAPKVLRCVLWTLVGIRLLCPFSLESALSLIPSGETVPQTIAYDRQPAIHSGIQVVDQAVNPFLAQTLAPNGTDSVNPMQVVTSIAARVWLLGVVLMALYALVSYLRVRRQVAAALPAGKGVWLCDHIHTPFILGLFRPRIYLPSSLEPEQAAHVIAHERAHLRRRDHWWKPMAFALLSVYWFHPLLWLAYVLLCRDIELVCDRRVTRSLTPWEKHAYVQALQSCDVAMPLVCPLAFGEGGFKGRIKSILKYKKPASWLAPVGTAACVMAAVCFLTSSPLRVFPLDIASLELRDIESLDLQHDLSISYESSFAEEEKSTWGKGRSREVAFGAPELQEAAKNAKGDLDLSTVTDAVEYALRLVPILNDCDYIENHFRDHYNHSDASTYNWYPWFLWYNKDGVWLIHYDEKPRDKKVMKYDGGMYVIVSSGDGHIISLEGPFGELIAGKEASTVVQEIPAAPLSYRPAGYVSLETVTMAQHFDGDKAFWRAYDAQQYANAPREASARFEDESLQRAAVAVRERLPLGTVEGMSEYAWRLGELLCGFRYELCGDGCWVSSLTRYADGVWEITFLYPQDPQNDDSETCSTEVYVSEADGHIVCLLRDNEQVFPAAAAE